MKVGFIVSGFFSQAKSGIAAVNRATAARKKVEGHLAAAVAVEVAAWQALFAVPGVSVETAAALLEVDVVVAKSFEVAARKSSPVVSRRSAG